MSQSTTMYIIQVDENGIPSTDCGLAVLEEVKLKQWIENCSKDDLPLVLFEYPNSETKVIYGRNKYKAMQISATIPIGSIEFTEKYLNKKVKAINIPKIFWNTEYCKGKTGIGDKTDVIEFIKQENLDSAFVKSAESCKAIRAEIVTMREAQYLNEDTIYFYRTNILNSIAAEWRLFINKDVIMNCVKYMGNWNESPPKESFVQSVIESYNKTGGAPPIYTLDIATLKDGTNTIIEIHNFISCGLYGYNPSNLLSHLRKAYIWEKDNNN